MMKTLAALVLAVIVYTILPSGLQPTTLITPLQDFINGFGLLSLFFGWLAAAFFNVVILFIVIRLVLELF